MYRLLTLIAMSTMITGCTVVDQIIDGLPWLQDDGPPAGNDPPDDLDTSAGLKAFESEAEFDEYFRREIAARNDRFSDTGDVAAADDFLAADTDGGVAAPVGPGGEAGDRGDSAPVADEVAGPGFSQTTIQEQGVDEADVVKTDGKYLYILAGNVLRVVEAYPSDQLAVAGTVQLEGHGRQLYLLQDRVVSITETYGGFYYGGIAEPGMIDMIEAMPMDELMEESGDGDSRDGDTGDSGSTDGGVAVDDSREPNPDDFEVPQFERPKSIVTVIDVSDRQVPVVLSTTRFDGNSVSSRMIDGKLHLIVANYPRFYYDVMPMLGRPELAVNAVAPEQLLPRYEQVRGDGTSEEGPVLTWRELYHPEAPDGFGVVTVISLDAAGDASFTAAGIVADPGLIYSSRSALYLTDTQWSFNGDVRETTSVHKLEYGDDGVTPVASGKVPGRILNQYSMSEYDGYLRVATTVGPRFTRDGRRIAPHNNVYVLDELDGRLEIVGSVEDIAPRETIQSARFIGDRGFVVTFEQVDPLFTLDLSDPTNPKIVGELKVPGFSTFLVPMDADHILALGQYIPDDGFFFGPWGVQLSIFDVSDFANPTLKHSVILGDTQGAYSEALRDPKALTYFADAGLLALPVSLFDYDGLRDDVFLEDDVVFIDDAVTTDDRSDDSRGDTEPGSVPAVPPVAEPMPQEPVKDEPVVGEPVNDQPGAEDPPTRAPDEDLPVKEEPDTSEPSPGVDDIFAPPGFDGLFVYEVSVDTGFNELGRISTRMEDQGIYWSSFTRGVFIEDEIYAVTDKAIRVAEVSEVSAIKNELVIGRPDIVFLDEE